MNKRRQVWLVCILSALLILAGVVFARTLKNVTVSANDWTEAGCEAALTAKITAVSCPQDTVKVVAIRNVCKKQTQNPGKFTAVAKVTCDTPSVSPSSP